ncbi:MAG: hypothetical protein PUC50_00005 [Bacteroidales bacterium]|nr:hypothetical protein [Bacteroidales bacterium]
MDYRDGEELWHFQWDMLQDPARKIFKWWQNEEGAESQGEPEPSERNLRWYKIPDSPISGIFLAPSRLPIWINDVQQVYVLESSYYGITVTNDNNQRPDDAIYGFKTSNGESFIAHFSNSDEFGGFYNDDVLYIDKEQKTFTNYGVYGNPIRYWSISDGKLNDTYNQSIAHKLPKGDAWGNYCAVINSIFDYISKLDLSDKAIWHPLENHISGIFIAPSKLPIWIDNVTQIYVLNSFGTGISLEQSPSEAIYGFKTSGGETFVARFSTSDKFEGFYNGDTRYVDKAKNTITKFGYEGNPIHYWVAYAFQSETEPKGELKTAQGTQGYTIPVPSNGAWDNYSAIVNESDYYEVYLGKLGQPISGMFLAPSDMPIWIDNVTDVYLSKPQNAIYGFKTANNETYFAKFSSNEFNGFYNFGTNKLYVDKNTFTLKAYGEKGYPIYFWDNSISNLNNTNSKFIAHKLPMDIYSDDNYSAVPHIPLYFEPQTADDMYCYVLYRRYRDTDSPLFNDQVWRTAIENNPCVLRGIVKFNPNMDKSEWMKEFDRFVSISMDVALIPAIIDILIVPVIDELGEYAIKRIIEQFGKDVVIKELLKKKGKDFLEGVGQKIVERILFWAINEAVKRWDCQKSNKLYQFTSYFDFEFASSELVCNYVVMLIESGLSNMISLKETQMWELFLTKCYVDCISVSQDWCDKLILCVEKNDFSWLEANILNCVINVLIGNMINSDFVVGFKSRFAIGVAADLAQDGFRELFKSWLSDVYGDSNGDEIFKEKSNNQ